METLLWNCRRITLDDVPALLEWYNDRALHEVANSRSFEPYTLDELVAYWKRKLSRDHARYYAIEVDGRLVGRTGLKETPKGGDIVEYSILIGDRSLHARGLGTAVTKRMLDEAFADPKVQVVRLYVRRDNAKALRCYEKSGYRSVHTFTQNGVPMEMMQVDRRDVRDALVEERMGDV